MTPEKLGRYEILGELGKGAMGVVYLAQDPIIKRQLAIKTFRMARSAKQKELVHFRERFLREAQAIGQLSHPNIVTVHDVGQERDEYFIAMEYVKGINLKQRMQREDGLLPLAVVLDVAAQIAEGLACAHEKGIVHRDVKPANVIITRDGQAKITDFGIARIGKSKLTVAGQLLGTPNYMAPEQIRGRAVDARTDVFSLGVMLYEMLTRKKPFQGENLTQVSHRIVYDEFTPVAEYVTGLPLALDQILRRALEKNPDWRYQDAAEMARDLRALLSPPASAAGGAAATGGATPPPAPPAAAPPAAQPPAPSAPPPAGALDSSVDTVAVLPDAELAPTADEADDGAVSEAPASPKARPPKARPPKARARLGLALAAAVVLAVAAVFLIRASGDGEAAGGDPPASPVEEFRRREAAILGRAEELAHAGVTERALAVLRDGMAELPLSFELTRSYLRLAAAADRSFDIVQVYVDERMALAEVFITRKEYEAAYDVLEHVLLADPEHEKARARAEDIERFLDRRRQARIRAARRAQATRPAPPPPPPPAVPAPPPAPGELAVVFRTAVAEGKVTVYANGEVVFERDFDFPNRRTFKRRFLKQERGFNETLALPAGVLELRAAVEVEVKAGRRTIQGPRLAGNVPSAGRRTLRVTVGESVTLDVQFE